MYSQTTLAKIEFILTLIDDIDLIINRHNNIDNALEDREGYHALLMCLLQIGESLSKIKEQEAVELLPISLAYKMRNIIAHDYISVKK